MKNATIEQKGRNQGKEEHRKFEDIVIPYQCNIGWVIADSDGCLGPAGGSEQPADMASLGFMRYTLDRNPEIRITFCTGRPVAYVTAMAQILNAFNKLEPEYREAFFNKTGIMLKGYPSVCENGAVIYDVAAKRAYPSPLMTQEQIESLNNIRVEVIPGLCHKTGMRQEAAAKLYCISLNPAPGQTIEEAWKLTCEQLKDYNHILSIRHSQSAVDINPRGIGKASTVGLILDSMGIDPRTVLGIGDSSGDEDWLKLVGSAAIPANGRKALMKVPTVRYVSPNIEAAGTLNILESVIDNNIFYKEYAEHLGKAA